MPRASHHQTVARQWVILKKLGTRRPGHTVRQLMEHLEAEGHPVSQRTVERDLRDLSVPFRLVTTEGTPPHGWRWAEGAAAELPGMDLTEALAMSLVGDLAAQLLPPSLHRSVAHRIQTARAMLGLLPDRSVAGWMQIARYVPPGMPLLPPAVPEHVAAAVEEALLGRKRLRVRYLSAAAGAARDFVMHPLALVVHGSTPYLVATLGEGTEVRQYPLHRFETAETGDDPGWRPDGFSLDSYLAEGNAQFGAGESIRLQARVDPDLARVLRETPLSRDQKITLRDGRHTLTATVRRSWQLAFYILSQGERMTVLKPKSLRDEIVATLHRSIEQYESA